jgi:hypothetical protein
MSAAAPKTFFALEMRSMPSTTALPRRDVFEDKENMPPVGALAFKTLKGVSSGKPAGLAGHREALRDITPPKPKEKERRRRVRVLDGTAASATDAVTSSERAGALSTSGVAVEPGVVLKLGTPIRTTDGERCMRPPRSIEKQHGISSKENGVMFNGWAARSFSIR